MNNEHLDFILNSNMSDEEKEALLSIMAQNMIREQEEQEKVENMSNWERAQYENRTRLERENPEFVQRQREKAKENDLRIKQYNMDARVEELIGILSHVRKANGADYLYQVKELEKMSQWDLEELYQILKENDPDALDRAYDEYEKEKKEQAEKAKENGINNPDDEKQRDPDEPDRIINDSNEPIVPTDVTDPVNKPVEPTDPVNEPVEPTDPVNEPVEPTGPEEEQEKTAEEYRTERDVIHILEKLGITKKEGKNYKYYKSPEIRFRDMYRQACCTGNVIYNVVGFAKTTLLGVIPKTFANIKGKLIKKETKSKYQQLEEAAENLTDEDARILFEYFKGSKLIDYKDTPEAVKTVIGRRIDKYVEKQTKALKQETFEIYQKIFEDGIQAKKIDLMLSQIDLSPEEQAEFLTQKAALLSGKKEMIIKYQENCKEIESYYSGGTHGYEEDVRASRTSVLNGGKNRAGYGFAKTYDPNPELDEQLDKLNHQANNGLTDEECVKAFMDYHLLQEQNCEVKHTIIGDIDVGQKNHTIIPGRLDYTPDTLMRDALVCATMITSLVSAANAVKTHCFDDPKCIEEFNKQQKEAEDLIHGYGDKIESARDDLMKGEEFSANTQVIADNGLDERLDAIRDGSNSGALTYGSGYSKADMGHHMDGLENFQEFATITKRIGNGEIPMDEAFEALKASYSDITNGLVDTCKEGIKAVQEYAKNRPQFHLGEYYTKAMQNIIDNPDALFNMNTAHQEILEIGNVLQNVELTELQELPSDLATTLIGCGTALTTAIKCAEISDMIFANQPGIHNSIANDKLKELTLSSANITLDMENEQVEEEEPELEDDIEELEDEYEEEFSEGRSR